MERSWCPKNLRLLTGLTVLIFMLQFAYGLFAHAQSQLPQDIVYLDASGNKLSNPTDALIKALHGEKTYKCAPQVASVNKTGSSIALRSRKKTLTKQQAEQQIKDIQSRVDQ